MSRTGAVSTTQKRRRHSSEPSPSYLNTINIQPLRKKLNFDSELNNTFEMPSGNNSTPKPSMSEVTATKSQGSSSEKPKSLFTDDDVQRLAHAVKNLMFDDLRNELRQDMNMFINNVTAPLYAEIQQLKQENIILKKSVSEIPKINSKLDELEQHSRKSCVRVSGVPQTVGENTTNIICNLAKKLNVTLEAKDISVSHRLPSKEGTRQIIARFTHADKRVELLKATKNIPNIPDMEGIGISQDLTRNRSKVAFLARQAVKQHRIKSSSVWDGKIFITDNFENKKIITSVSELLQIAKCDISVLEGNDKSKEETVNANSGIPPPQPVGMFPMMRSPVPSFLSQHGTMIGPPPMSYQAQMSCPPQMMNPQMTSMFRPQMMSSSQPS